MRQPKKLSEFVTKLGNIFGLEQQSRELLGLVTRTIHCQHACLVFLDFDDGDFTLSFCRPRSRSNPLANLRLTRQDSFVRYLQQERKWLAARDFPAQPGDQDANKRRASDTRPHGAELFVPLVGRDRLFGILALTGKRSGGYSPEDLSMLQEIADSAATAIEKEYLREQLSERVAELSVIGRSSTILASSLDIPVIFDRFVGELRRVINIDWAAVALLENGEKHLLAVSSEIGSPWGISTRIAANGTGTEWVVTHKKAVVEPDLSQASQFVTAEVYRQHRVRSIAHLPLISKEGAFGALIVASRQPNAYTSRHMALLEQLSAQIAMPIENSRLYSEVKEQAFVDVLTGLHNRRSLNEAIDNEISRNSRYGGVFSLIILDIDSLKAFNDRYGHLAGDSLLRRIGEAIRSSIRSADHAYRYGGDEFAILLPNTVMDAAFLVAERIRRHIASRTDPGEIPVSASLGLASWPADGKSANEIIAAADAALYRAKRNGGNCTCRADDLPQGRS